MFTNFIVCTGTHNRYELLPVSTQSVTPVGVGRSVHTFRSTEFHQTTDLRTNRKHRRVFSPIFIPIYAFFIFGKRTTHIFGRFRTADKMRARQLEMVKESGLVSSRTFLLHLARKPNSIVLIIFWVGDMGGIRSHPDRRRCALFPCQRPLFYRIFFRLSRRHNFLFGPRPCWRRATRIYRSKVIDNDYTRAQW